MACIKHQDREAAGACNSCGVQLCAECVTKYNIPLCDNCAAKQNNLSKGLFYRALGLSIVGLIVGILLATFALKLDNVFGVIVIGLVGAGTPWGWRALNRITSGKFLFLPVVGWLIYFLVKFLLSLVIGLFVMPIQIFRAMKGLRDSAKFDAYISESGPEDTNNQ